MDEFKTKSGHVVDLDNIRNHHLNRYAISQSILSVHGLWLESMRDAGEILFYMDYSHPDVDWGEQVNRIKKLCQELADMDRSDSKENRLKFIKWRFRFADEVENFC